MAVRTDRIKLAEYNSEHKVKATDLICFLPSNTVFIQFMVGFESDELHESVGVFDAVATALQSDPT